MANPLLTKKIMDESTLKKMCHADFVGFDPLKTEIYRWSIANWPAAADRICDGDWPTILTWLGAVVRAAIIGISGTVSPDHEWVISLARRWPQELLRATEWITPAPKTIKWWNVTLGPGDRGWSGWMETLKTAERLGVI